MLVGNDVYLRLIEEVDLALLVKWRNRPRIWDSMFNKFPISMGAQKDWYAQLRQSATHKLFVICLAATDSAVGTIGLDNIDFANRSAELGGLLIGEEASLGKGYAKEAIQLLLAYSFLRLNIHRLYLYVYAYNEPAVTLYHHCGFQKEGVLREARFDQGAYQNVLLLSMLASEYTVSSG